MIFKKDVKRIAELSKLSLTKEEISSLQEELGKTLEYIEILEELDTEKTELTSQVTGLQNVFRDDELKKTFTQEEALSGASSTVEGRFKISSLF